MKLGTLLTIIGVGWIAYYSTCETNGKRYGLHDLSKYNKLHKKGAVNSLDEYLEKQKALKDFVGEHWRKRSYPPKTSYYDDKDGIERLCRREESVDTLFLKFSDSFNDAFVKSSFWYKDKFERNLSGVFNMKDEYSYGKKGWYHKRMLKAEKAK